MTTDPGLDVHAAVRASRRELLDVLTQLDPDVWAAPSMCAGWTIAEVVAHLTLSTTGSWPGFIGGMLRHRGNFDAWNTREARRQAARNSPTELLALLAAQVDSPAHSPGSSHLDQLVDVLVHGQDICRAVPLPLAVEPRRVAIALDHAATSRWYGARARLAGVRLDATDTEWSHGDGGDAYGPALALLLICTGRANALPELAGPGVQLLRSRA